MALISLDRWLDRFGDEATTVAIVPVGLTFVVRVERRTSLSDRRVRDQPPSGAELRRRGFLSRRR